MSPKVVLWPTCLAALLRPRAARAARRVLERAGCEVETRAGAVCCGQPAWNSGHVAGARKVAAGSLDALGGDEPVVLCSGSCTTMVAHYWPELFEGTERAQRARDVASRARELCAFVADEVGIDALGPLALESARSVAYHDSCHMMRGLGISEAPRRLLGAISGLEVRELAAPQRCCGFGGSFSVRYPELSAAMADEKVDDLRAAGVEGVVASDLGCLMQIRGRAEARRIELAGYYVAEIVDEAVAAAEQP